MKYSEGVRESLNRDDHGIHTEKLDYFLSETILNMLKRLTSLL